MSFTLASLTVVLLASLFWSGLDLLRKVLVETVRPLPLTFLVTAGMLPFFVVWAWIDGRTAIEAGYWWPAVGSVVLNTAANLVFFEAVRISPLSVTIPLLSLTPVFVALLGLFLGQVPEPLQWVGIALVVAGALLLNLEAGDSGPGAIFVAFVRERGSLLMVAVALLWSATLALDAMAVEKVSEPFHGAFLSAGIGLLTLLLLVARGRLGDLAPALKVPGLVLAALVLGGAALGLQLVAIQVAWISLVETIKRGVGNALAVLFGRLFFREPVTVAKVAAVALMAAGVALVLR